MPATLCYVFAGMHWVLNGPANYGQPFTGRIANSFLLALIATAALATGAAVYMLDRPSASVYFLPHVFSFAGGHRPYFGALGGQFPDLAHVYAFILLSLAVCPGPARVFPICAFWWAVDSLFKIGQHPAVAPHIAAVTPGWFEHVPILENIPSYFLHGTFDLLDFAAIALGTVAAYLTHRFICQRRDNHESTN